MVLRGVYVSSSPPDALPGCPFSKTQKTRRLLNMVVFGWKPENRSLADVVSGPITANAAALGLRRLDARLRFLGGARQALAYDARGVRKDVMGP